MKGLFPAPSPPERHDDDFDTFQWSVRPAFDLPFGARIFTDGSLLDGGWDGCQALGWAFVVLNSHNHVTAVARGVPPHYVEDIPGAEAWALLEAATVALPGSSFYSDRRPCVDAVHAGRAAPCGPSRPLAGVFNMLFARLDDVPTHSVVWMPAHTAQCKVGEAVLSNGALLTHPDRLANQRADSEAKTAARQFALDPEVISDVQHKARVVFDSACWLGHATWLATHGEPPMARDSEASR